MVPITKWYPSVVCRHFVSLRGGGGAKCVRTSEEAAGQVTYGSEKAQEGPTTTLHALRLTPTMCIVALPAMEKATRHYTQQTFESSGKASI